MNLQESAIDLAQRGFEVFPLVQNTKRPSISEGCVGATTRVEAIKSWWGNVLSFFKNIGICCRNVFVLDIDVKGGNGLQDIIDMEKEFGELPKDFSVITPSGGRHLYFKNPPATYIGQVKIEWHGRKTNIDIRTGNQYVVAPPSIINEKEYKWLNGIPNLNDLPDLPINWQEFLPKKIIKEFVPQPVEISTASPFIIERARKYVQGCRPAEEGSGGQTAMFSVMNAIFNGFNLSKEDGMDILLEYNARCVPPWNLDNPADYKWFQRTIDKVINNPISKGSLANKPNPNQVVSYTKIKEGFELPKPIKLDVEEGEVEEVAEVEEKKEEKIDDFYTIGIEEKKNVEFSYQTDEETHRLEVLEEQRQLKKFNDRCKNVKKTAEDVRGIVKTDTLSIPGFVNTCLSILNRFSPVYNHHVCFAGSLILLSTLLGPKFRCHGLYGNMYIIALAGSGSGKDTVRKFNQKVLTEAYPNKDIVGRSFSSGEAIEDEILDKHVKLYQIDECDFIFKNISAGKDSFQRSIQQNLLELFTNVNGLWSRRNNASSVGKQNNTIKSIYNPYLNLFGTAPTEHYYNSLSSRMTEGGLFGRLMIMKAGQGDFNPEKDGVIPKEELEPIIEFAKWTEAYIPDSNQQKELMGSTCEINPIDIPLDKDAMELYSKFASDCRLVVGQKDSTETDKSTYNRAAEKAIKLAMLYEVSKKWKELLKTRDENNTIDNDRVRQILVVDKEAMEWAVNITKKLVCIQLEDVESRFYETTHEKNVKDVFAAVTKACSKSTLKICKMKNLLKAIPSLSSNEIEKILIDLVNQEKIQQAQVEDKKGNIHSGWILVKEDNE